jgi:hypothetical protein
MDAELAKLLEHFDAFCARARERLIEGHARYGDAWRGRDSIAEFQDELTDALNYALFASLTAAQAATGYRRQG